ncbi:MAG: tRNA 4-thiouridine(8) synthase ThiI, partial [Calditrichia bacterium]|nr:tRNA 4-thiouridine(8) synthase ThiI [Calditrichia bacterium]
MINCILIHYGEISLKGRNQLQFRKQLLKNIQVTLKAENIDWPSSQFRGYLSLNVPETEIVKTDAVIKKLSHVFGITWFSMARRIEYSGFDPGTVEKILNKIDAELCKLAKKKYQPDLSFCVDVRRSEKRFPANSVDLERRIGRSVIANTSWDKVSLKNPDQTFWLEIQNKEIFLFTDKHRGAGGLPVNTAQKVLVMLSGGIDSPVAAYMAARRGCHIDFVHFTASHVSKEELKKSKIGQLAQKVSGATLKSSLYVLPSTYFDLAIAGKNISYELILFRRFMARSAEKLAENLNAHALVTGDNLSQVASQTLTNITSTTRAIEMPILQPLLTYDKEEIVNLAKKIETFELSIQPYKDCCSFFQRNPRTVSDHQELSRMESNLFPDYEKMIDQTIEDMFWLSYSYGKSRSGNKFL